MTLQPNYRRSLNQTNRIRRLLILTRQHRVENRQGQRAPVPLHHVEGILFYIQYLPEMCNNNITSFSYYDQPTDNVELRKPMRSSMRSSVTRSPSPPATPPFDNEYRQPMRGSMRSSRPRTPSPPPPPPPPPIKRIVNEDSSDSRLSELQFPPPPTELGRFRETITKQTLTETIVTRLTNNQRGKLPIITEV